METKISFFFIVALAIIERLLIVFSIGVIFGEMYAPFEINQFSNILYLLLNSLQYNISL
jgi:hypothetical protein